MRRLLTPGWLACHALAVVLMAGMLGLGAWQLSRAAGGNTLSWGYTLQWPVFAAFVGFVWGREVRRVWRAGDDPPSGDPPSGDPPHGDPASGGPVPGDATAGNPAYDDTDDPELAAYNRFLAWLSANPGARPVDYPG